MTRRVVAAMTVWGAAITAGWLLLAGGQVQSCLGPLGVTPEQCRAILGIPPETAWDRFANGPAMLAALIVGGWVLIALVAARIGRKRQRGGL